MKTGKTRARRRGDFVRLTDLAFELERAANEFKRLATDGHAKDHAQARAARRALYTAAINFASRVDGEDE